MQDNLTQKRTFTGSLHRRGSCRSFIKALPLSGSGEMTRKELRSRPAGGCHNRSVMTPPRSLSIKGGAGLRQSVDLGRSHPVFAAPTCLRL